MKVVWEPPDGIVARAALTLGDEEGRARAAKLGDNTRNCWDFYLTRTPATQRMGDLFGHCGFLRNIENPQYS